MAPSTAAAPIAQVVNTHANGDHCYGNILVDDAEIIATAATADEMSEVPPSLLAGLNKRPGRGRRPVPQLLRRVRLRRHRAAPARPHVRRAARPRGRRPACRADRGRPGAHQGRHPGLRARRRGRSTPATSCSSAARRSCGPARWQLGRGLRSDARHGRRRRSCPATARSPTRPASPRCATTCRSSTRPPAAGTRPASTRGTRRVSIAAEINARPDFGHSASSAGSRSTSTPSTATSIPTYTSPNVVEQFRRMAVLEHRVQRQPH